MLNMLNGNGCDRRLSMILSSLIYVRAVADSLNPPPPARPTRGFARSPRRHTLQRRLRSTTRRSPSSSPPSHGLASAAESTTSLVLSPVVVRSVTGSGGSRHRRTRAHRSVPAATWLPGCGHRPPRTWTVRPRSSSSSS